MNNARLSLKLLRGALVGGVVAIVGAAVVIVVFSLIAGYGLGALMMPLYFGAALIIYIAPAGLLVGALVSAVRLIRRPPRTSLLAYLLWIGVPILLLVGLAILPFRFVNQDRIVTHAARWTSADQPDCMNAVILMLVEYADSEIVCSPELLTHLQAQNAEVIPVQYRVTFDFGEPRSYQLIKVGSVDITWAQWIGGPSGCGSQYLPPCDSQQVRNGSPLYESSWEGE